MEHLRKLFSRILVPREIELEIGIESKTRMDLPEPPSPSVSVQDIQQSSYHISSHLLFSISPAAQRE